MNMIFHFSRYMWLSTGSGWCWNMAIMLTMTVDSIERNKQNKKMDTHSINNLNWYIMFSFSSLSWRSIRLEWIISFRICLSYKRIICDTSSSFITQLFHKFFVSFQSIIKIEILQMNEKFHWLKFFNYVLKRIEKKKPTSDWSVLTDGSLKKMDSKER